MMRQALAKRRPLSVSAKPIPFIAPVGGWRTDVPVGNMPPDAAASLVNWFPEAGFVRVRNGSTNYSSQMPAPVQSVIPYSGPTINLFAAAGSTIYDVTGGNSAIPAVSGFTNAHWSSSQISTVAGKFLTIVNGSDAPQQFNGTAWTAFVATGGPASLSQLSIITTYRERLYFLESGTSLLWYLGTQSITGAMGSLDIGADMKFGGSLVALGTWTAEVATGILEFLVVVSSEGEVLVWQGSDPTDPTNFSLLGTFKLSPPLGADRCLMNMGADLAIMTNDAVIPISKAIQLDPSASDIAAITSRIAPTWLDTVQSVGIATPGWQFIVFPRRRMAIVNIPDPAGTYQYAMNTETKAWCQFKGMPAECWCVWENNLYFGTSAGYVVQADIGSNDNGSEIDALSVGAWSRGDGMSMKQPGIITADMNIGVGSAIYAGVCADYNIVTPTSPASPLQPRSAAEWDVAVWDVDTWPGAAPVRLYAASACPPGAVLAPAVYVTINGETGQQSDCYLYGGSMAIEPGLPI